MTCPCPTCTCPPKPYNVRILVMLDDPESGSSYSHSAQESFTRNLDPMTLVKDLQSEVATLLATRKTTSTVSVGQENVEPLSKSP